MHRLVRHLATLTCAIAFCTPALSAENKSRVRNATAAEIRAHIDETSKRTTSDRNGYSYQAGSKRGYKISNGKICILFENRKSDCADIKTDGTKFHMITRDGTRSKF